ncbi:helix-turn-helix domain-containing protein [Streptomyces sp. M19]
MVRMLAEGVKDEKIARNLGISPRTTSRYIAEFMQRVGSPAASRPGPAPPNWACSTRNRPAAAGAVAAERPNSTRENGGCVRTHARPVASSRKLLHSNH